MPAVARLYTLLAAVAVNMAGGFEALGLAPELVRAVTEDLGYLLPTNVQVTLSTTHNTQQSHSNVCTKYR